MKSNDRLLSAAMIAFGIIFCAIYPLALVWPSGWVWHEGSPAANNYYMMIIGVYATLGVFLIRAASRPAENLSLIWFTIWSSVVHAVVMAVESFTQPIHHGHLAGDVPGLLIVAAVLAYLVKRESGVRAQASA